MTRPIVEVAFGSTLTTLTSSTAWTDLTGRVDLAAGIRITRGASDELSETQAGTATVPLDNSDGALTPARSSSPYYPNVKKNVPIRISVATMESVTGAGPWTLNWLSDDFDDGRIDTTLWAGNFGGPTESNGRARVPCSDGVFAGLQSSRNWAATGGGISVKIAALPVAGAAASCTAGVYINAVTSGTRAGFQYDAVTGQLRCVSDTGFFDGSAVSLTYSAALHTWLRIREAGATLFWETSGDGHTWTVRRTLATPAWVGTDVVTFSLEANRTGGVNDHFEVDMVGATVHPRFFGMVNEWPLEWTGLQAKTTISCSDLFKWARLEDELKPMLSQEILLDRPTAYYSLDEPADSTSAGNLSATAGVAPLAIVQAGSGGTLVFAEGAGPSDGLGCPVFTPASASAGKYLSADLGQGFQDANLIRRVRLECWFTTSTSGRVLLALTSTDLGTRVIILLESGTGKVVLEKAQDGSSTQTNVFATPNLADGNLHHLAYNELANELVVDGTTYSLSTFNGADLRVLSVGGYQNARLWSGTIAQLAIYCTTITTAEMAAHYTTGTTEHVGESAAARMSRIASYLGLTVTTTGSIFDGMGSQKALGRAALTHLREVESTESGKLLASRSAAALIFQSRDVRYNPIAALSLTYADLETDGVKYADDDQKMINDVTASRPGGATQRVVNQTAVDTYGPKPQTLELFKDSDLKVTDAANWLVSRYADPPPEIRQVPVEAYSLPAATYRTLLNADVSTVLELTGLPDQAPAATATVCIEGYEENIGLSQHRIDFHTSRAQTDTVWVLNDSTYSVLDSTTRLAY
jgi:hypothetical protein